MARLLFSIASHKLHCMDPGVHKLPIGSDETRNFRAFHPFFAIRSDLCIEPIAWLLVVLLGLLPRSAGLPDAAYHAADRR